MTMRFVGAAMSILFALGCAMPTADRVEVAPSDPSVRAAEPVAAAPETKPGPSAQELSRAEDGRPAIAPEPVRRGEPDGRDVSISVLEGGWGDARTDDIAAVLLATARCFQDAVEERAVDPVVVERSPRDADVPMTLIAAAGGRTKVRLATGERRWAQFAFQFAHEYCHVLTNHRVLANRPFGWINESICEAASLFALETMVRTWKESPPYPNWREYAPSLATYAEERRALPEHVLPDGATFSAWLTARLPDLKSDPWRRADNVVVAKQLLPVFEESPDAWKAIRYLNLWAAGEDASIAQYFTHWRDAAPERLRPVIDRIERRLVEE